MIHTECVIRKAYKFILEPDNTQEALLRVMCGHSRFIWNKALYHTDIMYRFGLGVPRYESMSKWITAWKKLDGYEFLSHAYTDNLQQKVKDLDIAWKRFFDKSLEAEKPRFKRKGQRDSIRFVNFNKYCKLDNRRVKLPNKLGWMKFRKSRKIEGAIKNCTVSFHNGKWHISFQTEQVVARPKHSSNSAVGVDMGIAKFITLSNGEHKAPMSPFRHYQIKLAKAQRTLAKKKKFSNNWKKQKTRVNKIHTKIANIRNDFLHKTSTELSKSHAMIAIEDLKVSNMSRSAKGDSDNHGKNVKAKSGLNKSILDQGWYEFRRQLEYKQAWSGGIVVAVAPHYTSQTCPSCQHVSGDNRKTQSSFKCVECSYENNADIVGAINVLARGHRVLACGEIGLPTSLKQELVGNCEKLPPKAAKAA